MLGLISVHVPMASREPNVKLILMNVQDQNFKNVPQIPFVSINQAGKSSGWFWNVAEHFEKAFYRVNDEEINFIFKIFIGITVNVNLGTKHIKIPH